jgi:sugar phosphate isomerase/epimerase
MAGAIFTLSAFGDEVDNDLKVQLQTLRELRIGGLELRGAWGTNVLKAVNSPHLRFAWDPANFVQVGVAGPMTRGWEMLKPYIAYVHVKDALLADGGVKPAGEGDGQVKGLLIGLKDMGYRGVLALEPHLQVAGHSGGFSGAEGMEIAAAALRKLMAEVGCQEA